MRHCFDCASDKSCIVGIWSHLCILRKERERGDSFTLFVKLCLTERFQIIQILENSIFFFKLFKKEIWIRTSPSDLTISSWSDWEIVMSALQLFYPYHIEIETAPQHVVPNLLWQARRQFDQFLRTAFIEPVI